MNILYEGREMEDERLELASVEWPGRFSVAVENLDTEPPSTVAVSYHAPSVAKRLGTTAEEVKAVIGKFDFIVS